MIVKIDIPDLDASQFEEVAEWRCPARGEWIVDTLSGRPRRVEHMSVACLRIILTPKRPDRCPLCGSERTYTDYSYNLPPSYQPYEKDRCSSATCGLPCRLWQDVCELQQRADGT